MDHFYLTKDDIVDILHVKNESKLNSNDNKESIIEIEYHTLSEINKNEYKELISPKSCPSGDSKSTINKSLHDPTAKCNTHWPTSKYKDIPDIAVKHEFGSESNLPLTDIAETKKELDSPIHGDIKDIDSKIHKFVGKIEQSSSGDTGHALNISVLHTEIVIKEENDLDETSHIKNIADPIRKENVSENTTLKNLKVVLRRVNASGSVEWEISANQSTKKPDKIETLKRKLAYYKVLENDKVEEMIYTIYKCEKCDYVTVEQNAFKEHLVIHEPCDEKFSCKLCKYETQDESSFKQHIESCVEIKAKQRKYICSICQYETLEEAKYKVHLKKHKKSGYVQCNKCLYSAKNTAMLNLHKRRVHSEGIDLQCTKCDFSTKYRQTIMRHEKQKHNIGNLKEYKCSQCDYTSVYTSNVARHKKMVHGNKNFIFKCDQCSFQTKYKDHIKPHIRHHLASAAANFACELCNYKTVYRQNLWRHRLQIHSNPDSDNMEHCSLCDYKAWNKYELKRHTKVIHGNSDNQVKYKCKECSYFSPSKRYLKLHMMRLHLDRELSSRFTCDICDTSFITKTELKQHILMRHLAEFQCADCSVTYKKKIDLIQHIRKMHKKVRKICSKSKGRNPVASRTG